MFLDPSDAGPARRLAVGAVAIEGALMQTMELRLGEVRPLLLSSTVRNDNTLLTVDLMNRDTVKTDTLQLLPGTLHIFRSKFLCEGAWYERVRITNYGRQEVLIDLSFRFRSDFADIFELRGSKRERRGEMLEPDVGGGAVLLRYLGLDGVERKTSLAFMPEPERISSGEAHFRSRIEPQGKATFFLTVRCDPGPPEPLSYGAGFSKVARAAKSDRARDCEIETSNGQFNEWLARSQADLNMMITQTPYGPYPFAGVPLFNTVFGRDGLITALQALWTNPEIARGVVPATRAGADAPPPPSRPCPRAVAPPGSTRSH